MKIPRNKAAKGRQTRARNKNKPKIAQEPSAPPAPAPRVWQPSDALDDDEELDFDMSAYLCLVRFTDTWPALSFDVVPDPSGVQNDFPHTVYFIAGTQAPTARDNYLSFTKVKNVHKFKPKDPSEEEESSDSSNSDDSSSASEEEEEMEEEQKEAFFQQRVRHLGGVNRLRVLPQDPRYAAVWNEKGSVEIFDMARPLDQIHQDQTSNDSSVLDPMFLHKHGSEGFALDWSRVKQGLLASGDCKRQLKIWQPQDGGSWSILPCKSGHADSVEDIQWSPTEETVLASGSVDRTIKIWDTRELRGARLTVEASSTDINVLSWNKEVTYMLASGDDQGVLKIWDLRNFKAEEAVAEFRYHKKSITSVQWCPHESSMLATASEDDQIAIWDLALERDPEEEAQFALSKNAQLPSDVPPQLLFLHAGQAHVKELHWHPQIPGMVVSTAGDGINLFKPANL